MNKRALLIGINHYPHLSGSHDDLRGAKEDATALGDLLRDHFGFPAEGIELLLDEAATRSAILGALDQLASRTDEGDIVVVTFAGHGSQAPDTDGDEPDRMDETIIPYDGGYGDTAEPDIRDDEIRESLVRIEEKTPYLTVIFDCCHSGSALRDAFGERVRGVPPRDGAVATGPEARRSEDRRVMGSDRYVFLAACGDGEIATEIAVPGADDRAHHGLFTLHLLRELWAVKPGTTMRQVFERVSAGVSSQRAWQHPSAEGALDREVFGVRDLPATPSAPVVKCVGSKLSLGAGAAHGLTVGSRWEIRKRGSADSIGRAELTAVRGLNADAKITAGGDDVVVWDRAVEIAHCYMASRYEVEVQAAAGLEGPSAELVKALEGSSSLSIGEGDGRADARVYALAARSGARDGDPVPQLEAIETPRWAVVGREGRLILPTIPLDVEGAARTLRDRLETLARQRRVKEIKNEDRNCRLEGKVVLDLLVCTPEGDWAPAKKGSRGLIEVEEGDRLAIEVQNDADKALYIGLFDLGLSGGVSPAPPLLGPNEALAPGRRVALGARDGGIPVEVPVGCPFDPGSGDEAGVEILKLFATTVETDFGLLAQKGIEARGRETVSIAGALLRSALLGERDSTAYPMGGSGEDWTTVEVPFLVRRARRG